MLPVPMHACDSSMFAIRRLVIAGPQHPANEVRPASADIPRTNDRLVMSILFLRFLLSGY